MISFNFSISSVDFRNSEVSDVEEDLKVMGIRKAKYKSEWAKIVREALALDGLCV